MINGWRPSWNREHCGLLLATASILKNLPTRYVCWDSYTWIRESMTAQSTSSCSLSG